VSGNNDTPLPDTNNQPMTSGTANDRSFKVPVFNECILVSGRGASLLSNAVKIEVSPQYSNNVMKPSACSGCMSHHIEFVPSMCAQISTGADSLFVLDPSPNICIHHRIGVASSFYCPICLSSSFDRPTPLLDLLSSATPTSRVSLTSSTRRHRYGQS
jgi:hypothetical protein